MAIGSREIARLEALECLGYLASLRGEYGGCEGNHGSESDPLVDGEVLVDEDERDGRDREGQKEDPDLGVRLSLLRLTKQAKAIRVREARYLWYGVIEGQKGGDEER